MKDIKLKIAYNLLISLGLFLSLAITSCQKEVDRFIPDDPTDSVIDDIIDTLTGIGHEESADYDWDENSEIDITLSGNSIHSSSGNVVVEGRFATIKAEGNYRVSGNLTDGAIIVDVPDDALVRIILDNASIHNSDGPAILILNARKVIIILTGNSTLSDGTNYSDPNADPNAALFSKSNLTIFGDGSLSVEGNYKDGITSKDGLLLKSGNYQINSNDDGIRGKNYLIIQSGTIIIQSGGDAIKSDELNNPSPGNVIMYGGSVTAVTDGDGISAEGNVLIQSGYLNLLTGGGNEADTSSVSQKGIKAGNSVILDADSIRIDAVDHAIDSDGSITISGGSYAISSARAGIHSNIKTYVANGEITILRSMEGFESHEIVFDGGTTRVISIDDCLNATAGYDVDFDDKSSIVINEGYLVLDCINGDGIDSNGSLRINGGTIIIHGPLKEPNVAIDSNVDYIIDGGFLAAAGTNSELIEYPDSSSKQNSVVAIFSSEFDPETIFHITNSNNENILTFIPSGPYQSIIFSSEQLINGGSYSIYTEGTAEGAGRDGIIEGPYSPGNWLADFTVDGTVTVLNNLKNDIGH